MHKLVPRGVPVELDGAARLLHVHPVELGHTHRPRAHHGARPTTGRQRCPQASVLLLRCRRVHRGSFQRGRLQPWPLGCLPLIRLLLSDTPFAHWPLFWASYNHQKRCGGRHSLPLG